MIKAENLKFKYPNDDYYSLDGLDIEIREGEFVAVLGRNGSGKSTLAKHLNTILLPNGGSVVVDGMDTKDETILYEIRKTVGMVFQNPDNQIVATIVEEDVAFAPENLSVPSEEIRIRVDEALEAVGMTEYKGHAPHLLSGGQKQRIAIAGVLAMKPKYIVLDEPTAMLDPLGRSEVIETLHKLNREHGITIVIITHNMEETVLADRILVMDSGKIVLSGTPREVFSDVEKIKKLGLEVPAVTELMYEMRKDGYDVPCNLLTPDEVFEVLSKRKRNGDKKSW